MKLIEEKIMSCLKKIRGTSECDKMNAKIGGDYFASFEESEMIQSTE